MNQFLVLPLRPVAANCAWHCGANCTKVERNGRGEIAGGTWSCPDHLPFGIVPSTSLNQNKMWEPHRPSRTDVVAAVAARACCGPALVAANDSDDMVVSVAGIVVEISAGIVDVSSAGAVVDMVEVSSEDVLIVESVCRIHRRRR